MIILEINKFKLLLIIFLISELFQLLSLIDNIGIVTVSRYLYFYFLPFSVLMFIFLKSDTEYVHFCIQLGFTTSFLLVGAFIDQTQIINSQPVAVFLNIYFALSIAFLCGTVVWGFSHVARNISLDSLIILLIFLISSFIFILSVPKAKLALEISYHPLKVYYSTLLLDLSYSLQILYLAIFCVIIYSNLSLMNILILVTTSIFLWISKLLNLDLGINIVSFLLFCIGFIIFFRGVITQGLFLIFLSIYCFVQQDYFFEVVGMILLVEMLSSDIRIGKYYHFIGYLLVLLSILNRNSEMGNYWNISRSVMNIYVIIFHLLRNVFYDPKKLSSKMCK